MTLQQWSVSSKVLFKRGELFWMYFKKVNAGPYSGQRLLLQWAGTIPTGTSASCSSDPLAPDFSWHFCPKLDHRSSLKWYYVSFQQRLRSVSKGWKERGRRTRGWLQLRLDEQRNLPPASQLQLQRGGLMSARTQLEVNLQPSNHMYWASKHLALPTTQVWTKQVQKMADGTCGSHNWKGRLGKSEVTGSVFYQ